MQFREENEEGIGNTKKTLPNQCVPQNYEEGRPARSLGSLFVSMHVTVNCEFWMELLSFKPITHHFWLYMNKDVNS